MSPSLRTTVAEPARDTSIVSRSDVVVVGGGPAGLAAAIAAARGGAKVTLVERYSHLGGLASGGLVLVLDDLCNGNEVVVGGICTEFIERMAALGLAVFPPEEDRRSEERLWRKWSRWGVHDFYSHQKPQPITYAVAFDPEGWKRTAEEMVRDNGIELRLHSWFADPLVAEGRLRGVVCETKEGRQAVLGDVVVDATGDLDVAARAGAEFVAGSYILTTVFRLGNVDTEAAETFEYEQPEAFAELDREAKRILGGSWNKWWLKTPLAGIVWCNCPHMSGYDGVRVDDLTAAVLAGRQRIDALVEYVRRELPGFAACHLVDVASQTGVRQTRLLRGEYVVTKSDIADRVHFTDSVARGRDYYTPYRALLPRGVDQLLVAGRHYSATPRAQRTSREIPPCMAMGEAAGVAAVMALEAGLVVRDVDVTGLQRELRRRGADPGDIPSANANQPGTEHPEESR